MKTLHQIGHIPLVLWPLAFACARALGQTWLQTGAPSNSWVSVSSSADGSRLVAATASYSTNGQSGRIYTSMDGGTNWTLAGVPSQAWQSVASSADGTKLAALGEALSIYASTNSGSTWVLRSTVGGFSQSLVSSADSLTLALARIDSMVYVSTNLGATWSSRTTPMFDVKRVACSRDGMAFVAGNNAGQVSSSTNAGVNWSKVSSVGAQLYSLAGSADLRRLVGVAESFTSRSWIVTSTNMGQSWVSNSLPTTNWTAVAASADGTKFATISVNGPIYSSSDSGATWISNDVPALHWQAVASTADGNVVYAAASNGGIWVGRTVPAPLLRITSGSNGLGMSWLVPSASFVLQQTLVLTAADWTDLTNAPTLNLANLNNELLLARPATNSFYRLKTR